MRRVAASFLAMVAGWAVLNLVGVPGFALAMGSTADEALGAIVLYGFYSSFVVVAAWLVVYLPVYALVPSRSDFWRWGVCVPAGVLIGALVPFGFAALTGGGAWHPIVWMAALVGGVAAVVGRWLQPWSRHYDTQWPEPGHGRRIPWLRA